MRDVVIRLGGSQARHERSITRLITYLNRHEGRRIVVFSAVPEILEIIQSAVDQVYTLDADKVSATLVSVYSKLTKREPGVGYTDCLEVLTGILKGVRLIGDHSDALKDQMLSFSEKLTGELFRDIFSIRGTDVAILWPEEMDLQVTPEFGNATFVSLDKSRLDGLEAGFYLVPGSYGLTGEEKIARAGKSAADYTAAFLVRALGVERLELWGMDYGFYRADPAIVPDAQRLGRLTYSEASELAYFDHISFHPRTVEPLETDHIPVYILDPESEEGLVDTIINTETYVEPRIVKSVASTDDISLLRLNGPGVGLKPGILARVTTLLHQAGINIKSVITSQVSIHLILDRQSGRESHELLHQLGFSTVREISLIEDVSLVGIVGHGMQQNYGVSARIFTAVAAQKINVLLSGSGASDLVSYLIVRSSDKEKSVREIYHAFFSQETL